VLIALDPAATEFFKDGSYVLAREDKTLTPEQMVDYLDALVATIRSPRSRTGCRGRHDWLESGDGAAGMPRPAGRRRPFCHQ
jgi:enolase